MCIVSRNRCACIHSQRVSRIEMCHLLHEWDSQLVTTATVQRTTPSNSFNTSVWLIFSWFTNSRAYTHTSRVYLNCLANGSCSIDSYNCNLHLIYTEFINCWRWWWCCTQFKLKHMHTITSTKCHCHEHPKILFHHALLLNPKIVRQFTNLSLFSACKTRFSRNNNNKSWTERRKKNTKKVFKRALADVFNLCQWEKGDRKTHSSRMIY